MAKRRTTRRRDGKRRQMVKIYKVIFLCTIFSHFIQIARFFLAGLGGRGKETVSHRLGRLIAPAHCVDRFSSDGRSTSGADFPPPPTLNNRGGILSIEKNMFIYISFPIFYRFFEQHMQNQTNFFSQTSSVCSGSDGAAATPEPSHGG